MKRLTKEDILEGTRKRVNLSVKEYGREVVVRPLSDEEITQIISKITPGAPEEGSANNPQIDLQKNFEALRLAVSIGMVEPQLSEQDVAKMKFGVPEFIGSYILEISGIVSSESAKKKGRK
jgi:hypothetical protein